MNIPPFENFRNLFPKNFWQSVEYKNFQEKQGFSSFVLGDEECLALGIIKPLYKDLTFIEINRGPLGKLDAKFVQELFEIAKKEKSVFARISPPVKDFSFSLISRFKRFSSKREVFPSHTLLLDLKKTEEEILAQMKPKGRYNIRVAQRKNIEIEESSRTDIFYTLLQETTERDGFSSHNEEYYKKFLEHFSDAHLFLAYIPAEKSESGNKEYIAGALSVGLDENTFIYYYGASSQKYKECMAPYLLQWYMITFAKEQGYTCYDFLGIAPENAPSSHRLFGVTQFKRKFGGEIKEYAKETDIVFSPFWYALYRARDFVMKVFSPLVAKR